jgi:hypothetical protein
MKKSLLLLSIMWGLIQSNFVSASGTDLNQNEEYNLKLRIRCSAKNLQVGDEIPIIFTIANKGEQEYQYETRNYDRSGRLLEYQLYAKDKNAIPVPDPRKDIELGIMGGLGGGEATISKGQSFDFTLALNRWALINKPGKYTVTGTYIYHIEDKDVLKIPDTRIMKTIEVKSKPIEIEIKSRSSRQMGKYIESLREELKQYPSSTNWNIENKREEIILKLDYTCDEGIIPTLIDLIYLNQHNNSTNDVFWSIEGFRCYLPKTPEIRNKLIKILNIRGFSTAIASVLESYNCDESIFKEILIKALNSDNPDIISEAAYVAQNHPSDEIMPLVIAVAEGNSPKDKKVRISENTRERAISALAYNRTDEGVEVLNKFKNDPNNRINKAAQRAIEQAYRIHPIYPEIVDVNYTAMLIPVALDTNYPRSLDFITEILKTRTEEGVEAIKKLAENPELNIPISETDSGVKTIRDTLRSTDENRRNLIRSYIEVVYRTYPGRAFREDDFPDKFQKILEERKAKLIEMIETWKDLKKQQ